MPYPGSADPAATSPAWNRWRRCSACSLPPAGIAASWNWAAGGRNLLPQAEACRASRFLGIDTSATQIAGARADATAAGLGNVEFRQASILDIDASWGEFDYILCLGVFSWVPAAVRQKILAVCRGKLRRRASRW